VAHACSPSYSGGRDQEDLGLRPAQVNSSEDPILKNASQKRVGVMAQGVGSEFKPQHHTHTHTHTNVEQKRLGSRAL
jgi:hypothetical protein